MNFLAQTVPDPSLFNAPHGSTSLWIGIIVTFVIGMVLFALLTKLPANLRRPLIVVLTFLSGLFYFLSWIWPKPILREPNELPRNSMEAFSFWLQDGTSVVSNVANSIAAFLIGLGIYSLLRIHLGRLVKMQKDWFFSAVLLLAMFVMLFFGYWDWRIELNMNEPLEMGVNWTFANYARDLLFDGLMQQMDSTMFSLIAFFILSAAYRAFRIRSIEATILLAAALIMMISLMPSIEGLWSSIIDRQPETETFSDNFKLASISQWMRDSIQNPGIRALNFGLGIGGFAMSIRIWLSLDKGVGN